MIAIIETTINVPHNLIALAKNLKEWGHKDIAFIIIGDVGSPQEIKDIETRLKREGFDAEYWDVEKQRKLDHPIINRTPFNSGRRRNIGTLLALRYGVDWAIYLDDDNYPTDEDFLSRHISSKRRQHILSSNHWYNTGELLVTKTKIFLRGFPLSRCLDTEVRAIASNTRKVIANQGLCLDTPDVDAMTHLVLSPEDIKCTSLRQSVILEPGTFIPVNSQNTAIHRLALPAYYLPKLGRTTDIIAGYILQKVAHTKGDVISVGSPCTRHIRNEHDFFKDMEEEIPGLRLIDRMLPTLEGESIKGKDYLDCYVSLLGLLNIFPEEVRQDMLAWSRDL